jgi:hypothetical protein
MSNPKTNHFVTGRVRLSYVHLNQPYAHQLGGEAKYSVTVLVPKSDIATRKLIDAAIAVAIQQGISTKWNGTKPPIVATPLYDGDGLRPNGEAFGAECAGHWVFTASAKSDKRPRVVSRSAQGLQDILDPSEIYSGIYGAVGVDAYPYNSNGKRGIAFGLTNVLKLADGDSLGGGTSAEDDFDEFIAPTTGGVNPITGLPY